MLGVLLDIGMHLLGQLAGRYQHQCSHRVAGDLFPFHRQALQQRQGEASRLAGAGLCRGHQVTAGQHRRDRLRLHGGRRVVAEGLQGTQQGFNQAKFGECHGSTVKEFSNGRSLPVRSPYCLRHCGRPINTTALMITAMARHSSTPICSPAKTIPSNTATAGFT
ncbi:hypothetical protein D9M71_427680 [compost metagenome]